jgi:hypothetical protein
MNLDDLLWRSESGEISPSEVAEVAATLAASEASEDAYTLLLILGKSGAVQHRSVVERWLPCLEDPMMARLALQVLCNYWDETPRYLPWVLKGLRRLSWDTEDVVRLAAISIAGEYLRNGQDQELLRLLMDTFESLGERLTVREAAYSALCRAAGRSWRDIPSAARHMDFERDVDPSVLSSARRRLAT